MKTMVNELLGKCSCNYRSEDFRNVPKSGTFFFCTIEEARFLQTMAMGVVAYDANAFKVSSWLPFIGGNALNWDKSYYLHSSQLSEREIGMFCRSNDGDKQWAGQLIRDEADIRLVQSQVMQDALMFVAPKRALSGEWRIWMANGKVIASTPYHNEFCEYSGEAGAVEGAVDFAKWLAISHFEPDERYVVDVAFVDNAYKVVEYNAYSTSGFYGVDVDELLKNTVESFEKQD